MTLLKAIAFLASYVVLLAIVSYFLETLGGLLVSAIEAEYPDIPKAQVRKL